MSVPQLDYLSGILILDLLHRLVYVSVLFVPIFLACRVLGRRLPYLQMTLWVLLFVRALLPVDYALPISLRAGLAPFFPDLFGYVEFRLRLTGFGYSVSSPPVIHALPWVTWQMLIVGLWFACLSALLGRHFTARFRYRRIVARGSDVLERSLLDRVDSWRSLLGIGRRVRLVCGPDRVSPFTMGVLRPIVYLPNQMRLAAAPGQIDAILVHELAHVKRLDDLWVQVQAWVVAGLCLFPPIYYASRQLTRQREIVCDQIAVARSGMSPRVYGESLLRVVGAGVEPRRPVALPALMGEAEFCSARIEAVGEAARGGVRAVWLSLLLAVSGVVFLMPLGPHGQGATAQELVMRERAARVLGGDLPAFALPIANPEIGRRFQAIPRSEQVSYRYHTGVDLIAPVGTPVRAISVGIVERVRSSPRDSLSARTGGYMTIRHGQYLVYYTYLADIRVGPGDRVEVGELLASLGPVPFSPEGKPSHMHLEITRNGVSVDPLPLLGLSY
ncbi:MAG: peptidoglycan DD-metalloendopeptidase family protein [Pseudomonadales bacterium]|nr:peptidoglycan DD-metalloendopeptidase family protein [Pseudomonadales bacterium]